MSRIYSLLEKIFNFAIEVSMKRRGLSEDYLFKLGHRIRIIRTFLKLDQKQMSERTHIAQSQISKIESGRAAPTLNQLLEIKKLADEDDRLRENLTWDWILEGKGEGLI